MFNRRTLTCLFVAILLVLQTIAVPAMADAAKVVTLGANLSQAEKDNMLRFFGVTENEVEIILITNQDERAQLGSLIPLEKIGTKTYSCALVNPTESGGIQVKTANLSYVSSNMIASTLSTSGVVNCDVLAAAPFVVSGTGALTGVMMAYETASGETLLPERKQLANEELVTTNKVAETIGRDEATVVVNDIKIRIIRDGVTEQNDVRGVVDDVVDTAENAMATRAMVTGIAAPRKLSSQDRGNLYDLGYKIGQMGYDYKDMQVTLERVTLNAVEAAQIEDPLVETFDSQAGQSSVSSESILMNTDDNALGDNAGINSTFDSVSDVASAASADGSINVGNITLSPYAQVKNASLVSDCDLLRIDGKPGYALARIDGTVLTESVYGSMYFTNGWISTSRRDMQGQNGGVLSAEDGHVAMPFMYGDVKILNSNWALGFTLVPATADNYDYESYSDNSYYLIGTVDVYWLPTATKVGTFARANYKEARAHNVYISIEDRTTGVTTAYDQNMNAVAQPRDTYDSSHVPHYETFSYNGQQGLISPEGIEILPASYRYVDSDIRDGYYTVSTGDKYGLGDLNGQIVVPAQYDRIDRSYYAPADKGTTYVNFGYVCVENGDKLGYYHLGEGETCTPKYASSVMDNYGVSALFTDLAGNVNLLAGDGVETPITGYNDVRYLNYSAGTMYRVTDANNKYGLIDWHGEEILPCKYDDIDLSGNGEYLMLKTGYKDPAQILQVTYAASAAPVVAPVEGPEAPAAVEAQPTAAPVIQEPVFELGNITLSPYAQVNSASLVSDCDLLRIDGDPGYALARIDGTVLTESVYGSMYFTNGWISTNRRDMQGQNIGVLSTEDGHVAMPFTYGDVKILNENWALGFTLVPATADNYDYESYSDNTYSLIGTVDVYWLPTATKVGTFARANYKEARAHGAYISIEDRATGVTTAYDQNMNAVAQPRDTYDSNHAPHYETFSYNGQQGLMSPEGIEILPASYRYVDSDIRDGYYTVSTGDKYGLGDLNGQIVVPAQYDRIDRSYYAPADKGTNFVNFGYVCVENGDKLGYYHLGEGETCTPKYASSLLENYGVSAMFTDLAGNVNLLAGDGVETPITGYNDVRYVNYSAGAMYRVTDANNKYGLIDWHGEEILPCMYDDIDLSGSGEYLVLKTSYRDPVQVFQVSYTGSAAPAVAPAGIPEAPATTETQPAAPAPAEAQPAVEPAAQAPVEAQPGEAPSNAAAGTEQAPVSNDVAIALLDSALTLSKADMTANAATVGIVLNQAIAVIGESNPTVTTLLQSVVTLIDSGVADGPTVQTLIQQARNLL